jgi:multisubunit Na+/H+ antiporter MnhB subunit
METSMPRGTVNIMGMAALAVMAGFLVLAVAGLPEFGSIRDSHVAAFFLEHGLQKTGSANIVNAIIWDFRGYDTLGEETILFCAALSVFMIIRRKKYGYRD